MPLGSAVAPTELQALHQRASGTPDTGGLGSSLPIPSAPGQGAAGTLAVRQPGCAQTRDGGLVSGHDGGAMLQASAVPAQASTPMLSSLLLMPGGPHCASGNTEPGGLLCVWMVS